MKIDSDTYLSTLAICIQQSEGVFCNDIEKLIAASTLNMLFFKFGLSDYIDQYDMKISDYENWFERPAYELGINDLLKELIFNNGDEDE